MRVPSTLKCSSESKSAIRARASTCAKNFSAMSPSKSRSRFLVNTVGTHTVFVHVQANKPSKDQVVFQFLHQHSFAANRIQHLQKQCSQQLLWRNRWTAEG